jgi:hypothetical protein
MSNDRQPLPPCARCGSTNVKRKLGIPFGDQPFRAMIACCSCNREISVPINNDGEKAMDACEKLWADKDAPTTSLVFGGHLPEPK